MLKPARGSRVSVIVFEDLGCPACASAHPIELETTQKYHIPLVRYDYPIKSHIWTFDAAVNARYLQDTVNPSLAAAYRDAIFKAQASIAGKEDLRQFTSRWMKQRGQAMASVIDPTGQLAAKVKADYDLGRLLNVRLTPTIIVVTEKSYQIVSGTSNGSNDFTQLDSIVRGAIAQTKTATGSVGVPLSQFR